MRISDWSSDVCSSDLLRTDYLDAVLLHSDGEDEAGDRFLPAAERLERLKRQGKLRATGFSGKTVAGGLHMLDHTDLLMVSYNPGHRDEAPGIAAAARAGRGVLVTKALARARQSDEWGRRGSDRVD